MNYASGPVRPGGVEQLLHLLRTSYATDQKQLSTFGVLARQYVSLT